MATHKTHTTTSHYSLLRLLLVVALLALAVWVLATHWQTVSAGLRAARHARLGWLTASLLAMAATFCVAAAIYGQLVLHRLRYRQTVLIEIATAFVNRLLPSGLGGLGLHGLYLYRRGHTSAEATAVVTANNILGMVVHLGLLGVVVLAQPQVLTDLRAGGVQLSWRPVAGVVALLLLVLLVVRGRVAAFLGRVVASFRRFRLAAVCRAGVLAAALTVLYTTVLFCTARSVGIGLDPLHSFVVFSIGMLVANATPTPGGLVGAEAGLYAGFVGYGVQSAPATAAVLLFRLASYWLPLIPGVFALFAARRRKLV